MIEERSERRPDGDSPVFALIHSPLVGPATWKPVAKELRRRGIPTVVPDLGRPAESSTPFWRQHAHSAAECLRQVPLDGRLILVGHSGAGVLLPAIADAIGKPIAYVFVDAGLPKDAESRLGTGTFAEYIRELYAQGGRFPNWTAEDLAEIIPDPQQRRRLVAGLRPQPLAFWEEPIPVSADWPDAPCGYLRFTPNPSYDEAAAEAQRRGWP
ncbi:MAG TPA: alpha/beta hydrolase, partial [Chloroflexota bacterium]